MSYLIHLLASCISGSKQDCSCCWCDNKTKKKSFRDNRAKKCSKIQPFVDLWICAPILFLFYRKFPLSFYMIVLSKPSQFASSPRALSLLLSLFSLIQTISLLVKVTFGLSICSTLALFFIHYPFQGIGTWSL